ncbi:MAG: hypothetical protein JST79_18815 [Acidobacteria bacterium]|nr:hypothetical protein [Acidobacteriota bacterium]
MRLRERKPRALAVGLACLLGAVLCAQASQAPDISAAELVRRSVQNEVNATKDPGRYMFLNRRETPRGSQTKWMVQTREGMASLIVAFNDQPLSEEQKRNEYARVERFLKDPDELKKKQKQETEDTERTTRIVKALPDAFLYEYDGTVPGTQKVGRPGDELVRLKFRPKPDYDPPSRVEQVLTGMQGFLLIDASRQRIAKIDGTLIKDVSFGWGILGHLDRGGKFVVEQANVNGTHWDITGMQLQVTGKILIFKSLNIQSQETFSDFHNVPADLSFAQGLQMLKKQEAEVAQNRGAR